MGGGGGLGGGAVKLAARPGGVDDSASAAGAVMGGGSAAADAAAGASAGSAGEGEDAAAADGDLDRRPSHLLNGVSQPRPVFPAFSGVSPAAGAFRIPAERAPRLVPGGWASPSSPSDTVQPTEAAVASFPGVQRTRRDADAIVPA